MGGLLNGDGEGVEGVGVEGRWGKEQEKKRRGDTAIRM